MDPAEQPTYVCIFDFLSRLTEAGFPRLAIEMRDEIKRKKAPSVRASAIRYASKSS